MNRYLIILILLFISNYCSSKDFNLIKLGVVANSVTDDTKALQTCFDQAFKYGGRVIFPKNKVIVISNEIKVKLRKNIKIELIGNNCTIKTLGFTNTLWVESIDATSRGDISVQNIIFEGGHYPKPNVSYFDGEERVYCITFLNVKNLLFSSCTIQNVYGTGLQIQHSPITSIKDTNFNGTTIISNNKILNCCGLKPTPVYYPDKSMKMHDNYGDGIMIAYLKNVKIINNKIYNDLLVTKYLGRCGIDLEYNTYQCKIIGNEINGYDRNIHIEASLGGHLIDNNRLTGSSLGIIIAANESKLVGNSPDTISNNYITNENFYQDGKTGNSLIAPRALIYFYLNSTNQDNSLIIGNTLKYFNGFSRSSFIVLVHQANTQFINNNIEAPDKKSEIYFHSNLKKFNENTCKNISWINTVKGCLEQKGNKIDCYSNFIK